MLSVYMEVEEDAESVGVVFFVDFPVVAIRAKMHKIYRKCIQN